MTLRARLTAAFLAVVLGPVLIGAVFVGVTVSSVSHSRSAEHLDLAVSGVRTALDALCQRLTAGAQSAALVSNGGREPESAARVVDQGLATAVQLIASDGNELYASPALPDLPWADCSGEETVTAPEAGYPGVFARVEMRGPDGHVLGYAYAVEPVDAVLVHRLAAAAGSAVTVLPSGGRGRLTTERLDNVRDVATSALALHGTAVGETEGGRYVRRLNPEPGQPLPLALSVPRDEPQPLYLALIGVVVLAALLSVLTAWWLAHTTTRPLTELTRTVERVADGDLTARVPVRSADDIGRLGVTFNRMTREMHGYVQALKASRDQLRGHLGLLGDTLSSTHDLDRILRVILQGAVSATGARAGVLLLLEPGSQTLVGRLAEGLPGDLVEPSRSLRLRLGEGLLGSVAAGGEARRGRIDRDGPELAAAEPRCLTYLVVPFGRLQPTLPGPRPEAAGGPERGDPGGMAALGAASGGMAALGAGSGGMAALGAASGDTLAAGDTSTGTGAGPGPAGDAEAGAGAATDRGDGCAGTPDGGTGWPENAIPARGVLALYDRHGFDEFDDGDVATLRQFAGQAAVALDNVRVHEETSRLSRTDPLTGLGNYRALKGVLRREVERASRFRHSLAVLGLDIDRFKDVNDGYGHAAGDTVLAEFARRLRGGIREVDFAFRQGGEEFVVLLPETDSVGALIAAERLADAIRATPVRLGAADDPHAAHVAVSVSIGVAVYPDNGGTGPAVLEAADDALYEAKAAGRDTCRVSRRQVGSPAEPARTARPDAASVTRGGAPNAPQPPRQTRGR